MNTSINYSTFIANPVMRKKSTLKTFKRPKEYAKNQVSNPVKESKNHYSIKE